MSISEAAAEPTFWIVSTPLIVLFLLSLFRIGRPFRK